MQQPNEPSRTTVRPSGQEPTVRPSGSDPLDEARDPLNRSPLDRAETSSPTAGEAVRSSTSADAKPNASPSKTEPNSDTFAPKADEFSSSAAPIGLGSNTPVGAEPSTFQQWSSEHPESSRDDVYDESSGGMSGMLTQAGPWGGGLALAAVIGGLIFSWWRRRRAPRTPIARLRRAAQRAGLSTAAQRAVLAAMDTVPRKVGQAAGRSGSPWLPFLMVPLALLLRSQGRKGERAGDELLGELNLEQRSKDLARQASKMLEKKAPTLIREKAAAVDGGSSSGGPGFSPWLLAVPAVAGGGFYAYQRFVASNGDLDGSFDGYQTGPMRGVRDVMSREVETISPDATVADAARKLRDLNVGSLPVKEGERLIGVLTDRDITVRATAEGKDAKGTKVREAMSPEVAWVFEDETAQSAAHIMRQRQVRRLPVLDRNDKLVGIIALGDLAVELGNDAFAGETLEQISKPGR